MGIIRQIGSVLTDVPIPGGSTPSSKSASQDQEDQGEQDYGSTYGERILRRVKRATKRISNGNGKRSD